MIDIISAALQCSALVIGFHVMAQ